MKRLTVLREGRGLTRTKLGFAAEVHPARIGEIELGRLVPRRDSVMLQRLAHSLDWQGDPGDLLDEVTNDEA